MIFRGNSLNKEHKNLEIYIVQWEKEDFKDYKPLISLLLALNMDVHD